MFERSLLLLKKEEISAIKEKKILLVGLGGVGGACFEMLIRLGFKNITIVDYDIFEYSNLNRQLLSNIKNIGNYKTIEAYKHSKEITNDAVINRLNIKLENNTIDKLDCKYDYIIDAIDDVNAKLLLIKFAIKNKIKIISCCGTGNRIDPSKLLITNIWKTYNDPLAKKLRQLLKKEGIKYKLPVLFSSEVPIKINKVGSLCLVPNAAGIFLVSYVFKDIINNIT